MTKNFVAIEICGCHIIGSIIDFLFEKFNAIDDLSLWRVEELIPVMLINKNMIDKNQNVKVRVYDRCYSVSADKDFNVSVTETDVADSELRL